MHRLLELGSRGGDVSELQRDLRALGFGIPAARDGFFDQHTRDALAELQRQSFLEPEGRAGPRTRAVIAAERSAQGVPQLGDYRGRLGFLLGEEGHRDEPHWPGGRSGVTLSPGFDLGQQDEERLRHVYGRYLSRDQLATLATAIGVSGRAAAVLVQRSSFQAIKISREDAARCLPQIAWRYWLAATMACPALLLPSAPANAHTALLSLAYNAGPGALRKLAAAAQLGDWNRVADLVGAMHANTPLSARRQREAKLIRGELRPPKASGPRRQRKETP